MKKRIWAVLLGVLIALSVSACSGDGNYGAISVSGRQDTSYTVYSNGGSAVQYGNYVYFINGNRGYDDADGTANIWGDVVKGALYRAELVGTKNGAEFTVTADADTGLEFVTSKGLDSEENIVDIVDVQLIAPKTIGTSGYAGGIYIFDDYVYYASPNNQQNKEGVVQSSKIDFFRTRLDGSRTQKIFTTTEDSASNPYGFYKYDGSVYLVVLDGTTLKTVRIGSRRHAITQIAEDVTSVVIPERPVYYAGINENGVENFVYFTRAVDERTGTTLECVRPDGSERFIFHNSATASIDAVRDGLVYYRTVYNSTETSVCYTNLHSQLMDHSETYKAAPAYSADMSGTVVTKTTTTINGYTYTYTFRPDSLGDEIYFLYTTSAGIFYESTAIADPVQIYSGTANVQLVEGNDVYFTDSTDTNIIYSTNLFTPADQKDTARTTLTGNTTITGPGLDIAAGYLVYFAAYDDSASDYTFFYKLDDVEITGDDSREALFVGVVDPDDVTVADDTTDDSTDTSTDTAA